MSTPPFDPRARLRFGDDLVREHRYAEAISVYQTVASYYLDQGFALRAVAVARQAVDIADIDPNALLSAARPALLLLVDGHCALGLEGEAHRVAARLRELQ